MAVNSLRDCVLPRKSERTAFPLGRYQKEMKFPRHAASLVDLGMEYGYVSSPLTSLCSRLEGVEADPLRASSPGVLDTGHVNTPLLNEGLF